jgi:hypothetical protein
MPRLRGSGEGPIISLPYFYILLSFLLHPSAFFLPSVSFLSFLHILPSYLLHPSFLPSIVQGVFPLNSGRCTDTASSAVVRDRSKCLAGQIAVGWVSGDNCGLYDNAGWPAFNSGYAARCQFSEFSHTVPVNSHRQILDVEQPAVLVLSSPCGLSVSFQPQEVPSLNWHPAA